MRHLDNDPYCPASKDHTHNYEVIKDEANKKVIRKLNKTLGLALWRCTHCGKITESM